MGVLESILTAKRESLRALRQRPLPAPPPPRDVQLKRASGQPLRIIAEIKRRSPSAGALSTRLGVAERAAAYQQGGAAMLSILTDEPFFDGRYEDLQAARGSCDLPLLCKDFVLDEVQLDAARAFGADAVLLIVRCVSATELPRLVAAARERGLMPLVEVTTELEAQAALDASADVIGVNARDLDTLQMDAARTARVLAALPAHVVKVHLSGVSTPAHVIDIARGQVDAALIGEALMRQDDPLPLLSGLTRAAAENLR